MPVARGALVQRPVEGNGSGLNCDAPLPLHREKIRDGVSVVHVWNCQLLQSANGAREKSGGDARRHIQFTTTPYLPEAPRGGENNAYFPDASLLHCSRASAP